MFRIFTDARENRNDTTNNSDDAIKIALIGVSITLSLIIVVVLVAAALLKRRFAHTQRSGGAMQEVCAPPVAEDNSAMSENANYSTLEL